jgi:translocation and assembly module TamB
MSRRPLLLILALAAALPLLLALFLAWALATPAGLRFTVWLARNTVAPGLQVEAVDGRLLGPLRLGRLVYATAQRRIVVEDVAIQWRPGRLLDEALVIDRLAIGRLQVASRRTTEEPQRPPELTLPLAVRVDQLGIGRAGFGELVDGKEKPGLELSAIDGRFVSDGRQHEVTALRFTTSRLAVEASGKLGGLSPFPTEAKARITGEEQGHPFTVALDADGTLRALAVTAQSTSGTLKVDGFAQFHVFDPQPLIRASLTAVGLDPATWVEGAPRADLSIEAVAEPVPGSITEVTGQIMVVNSAPGRLDQSRIPLRRLHAGLHQEGRELTVPEFAAELVRGRITGFARWAERRLEVGAQLADVDAGAWHKALHKTRLSGPVQARLSAEAQQVQAQLRDARFRLELDATRTGAIIRLATARLATRGGHLELSGQVDPRGDYDLQGRLRDFDPSAYAAVPRARVNATLDAKGRLGDQPTLDLHFALGDSVIAGTPASGRGDVVLRPDRLEQAELSLHAGDNRVEGRGALGKPGDVLTLTIEAPRLEQLGMEGALRGNVMLFGSLQAPGAQWKLGAPRLILPGGRQVRELASHGRLEPGGGSVQAELTIGQMTMSSRTPPLSNVSARVEGPRARHRVHATARVGDDHSLEVAGQGGLGADRVWRGRIDTGEWRGPNPARLLAAARLEVGAGRLALEDVHAAGQAWEAAIDWLRWRPERLQSRGRFSGLRATTFLLAAAPSSTLRLGGEWNIDFGSRVAGSARLFRQEGDLALRAGDEVLFLGLEQLQLSADFSGQQAVLSLQAHGRQAGTVEGHLSSGLRPDGGGWTLARNAPWQGSLQVNTPSLVWLSPLAGPNVSLDGHLQGAVTLGGTPAAPTTLGQVFGSGLRLRLRDQGLDLGAGVLRLELTPEVARLQRLEFVSVATQRPHDRRIDFGRLTARPGRLSAEGEVALKSGTGRIRLSAEQLVVSQLPRRWLMVSGTGGAQFSDGGVGISGDLRVDAAYVELAPPGMPTLSEDVVVVGREKKGRPAPRVNLDVAVSLGDSFYFQGAGIESRLAGELRLAAARRAQLRASGSVRTVGGTFDAYGRELAIERGILNFQGLIDNPGLNVRAVRRNLPVEAGMEVTGTLKDPKVRLVSVPEVPDTEKLSWMVLGRPPGESLGTRDADLLLSAAMALRGNQGKGPLQSLMQGLGLEELSISAGSLGGPGRAPATHVAGSLGAGGATTAEQIATVGKRIGANTVLSYERSLTTAESVLKLTVDLSRRLSMVGRVGADNAIDLLYTFTFGGGEDQVR